MTPPSASSITHSGYVARETLVSVVINAAISLAFALAVAHGRSSITLWGGSGIAVDFVPQIFMVTFATTLAVTILTRRRIQSGALALSDRQKPSILDGAVHNAFLRALLFGAVTTLVLAPISALVLFALGIDVLTTPAFIALKVSYGAALTALIAPHITRAALASVVRSG